MANHGARTHIKCARSIMQALGFADESPINIVSLRDKHGLTYPSESKIQQMFGQRLQLAKRGVALAVVDIFNREMTDRGLAPVKADHLVHFNSIVKRLGPTISQLEMRTNSSTDVQSDIAAAANLEVEIIAAAMRKRLLPRAVCERIESAVRGIGIPTYGIETLQDADVSADPPAREVRASVLTVLNQDC